MPRPLSVIIVTFNAEAFIADCLGSAAVQAGGEDALVVVDNASTDATAAIVRSTAPGATFISSAANVGFAAATNIGIRQTESDLVLLLNPDTRMHAGALDALRRCLALRPEVGIAGPKLVNADGSLQQTGRTFPSPWNLFADLLGLDRLFPRSRLFGGHRRLDLDPEKPADADYLQGSCLLIRRSLLETVGLFDDRFFLYFEETDFCRRARDGGWAVAYVPDAVVTHFGGSGSSTYSGVRLQDYHTSMLRYLHKHETPVRRGTMRWLLTVRALSRSALLALLGSGDRARGYWISAGITGGWRKR